MYARTTIRSTHPWPMFAVERVHAQCMRGESAQMHEVAVAVRARAPLANAGQGCVLRMVVLACIVTLPKTEPGAAVCRAAGAG